MHNWALYMAKPLTCSYLFTPSYTPKTLFYYYCLLFFFFFLLGKLSFREVESPDLA